MSDPLDVAEPAPTREQIHEIAWASWVLMALGAMSIIAGVIVIAKPDHSLATLAVVCGLFVLIDSIFELVVAIRDDGGAASALLGVVGIVIGILLVRHPTNSVLAVALLVGIWLVAIGVIRLVSAFSGEHRVWRGFVAVVEIVAGIVIVSDPHIGFTALAVLLGISLLVNGIALAGLGWAMHQVHRVAAQHPADHPGTLATP